MKLEVINLPPIQSFDDFLLVPYLADFERDDIQIYSNFFGYILGVPVISSPMDTITGRPMLDAMRKAGGIGVHHRYCQKCDLIIAAGLWSGGIAVSPSMGIDFIKMLLDVSDELIVVLDVAHGHTKRNLDFCEEMVKLGVNVVSGNIVTEYAALQYYNVGVKYFRVGLGSGSVCTTRTVTGCGYPQAQAIREIYVGMYGKDDCKIISDGGHRTTGDIVKALSLGADFVMLGGMLAGTDEAEGGTEYRGMASAAALSSRKKEFFVEGIGKNVEKKGSVAKVLSEIKDAILQACYYTGSRNLSELKDAEKIAISDGAKRESYYR